MSSQRAIALVIAQEMSRGGGSRPYDQVAGSRYDMCWRLTETKFTTDKPSKVVLNNPTRVQRALTKRLRSEAAAKRQAAKAFFGL